MNEWESSGNVAAAKDAPLIVLVAGEASGDNLGAQLITALRQRIPQARFAGIAGSRMVAAGCEAWDRVENLSVPVLDRKSVV